MTPIEVAQRLVELCRQGAYETAQSELYAAEATGTWSITLTLPDGRMCLMASGANYETVTEDLPAKGYPA